MFNRTYTRLVRKAVVEYEANGIAALLADHGLPVVGPVDETVLTEIMDRCVAHATKVEAARATKIQSLGIPMWETLARYDAAPVVAPPRPRATKRPTRKCGKCNGSGVWHQKTERTAVDGSTVKAVCYACHGKGKQDEADQRRNWGYHSFYYRLSA